ncbi:immune inhibitor A [Priestia megaterium]|uniref:Immune inhibitor A n=1 Tax=Priestia megaterium TaxID=1404 RepID=A0ABD4WWJ7_PRIMG|nr:immune inhibitor A domain-containing protein [Priestia megaterium]MBV6737748.1 immune inhibitor A [Priestia megaterium]MDD9784635.1 immune inhibitor A [Priestia megaterium]
MTNWKKILGTSLLATTVTIGGVTPLFGKGHVVSAKTTQVEGLPSSPIDMHTVPEERLTKALKDQGVISQKATPQEAKKALNTYINKKDTHKESLKGYKNSEMDLKAKKFQMEQKEKVQRKEFSSFKAEDKGDGVSVKPAKQAKYMGQVRKDKVLVLLVEYADFKHNNVIQEPGYMYSKDFNQQHYQKLMFGDKDFKLFDGSKIKTFKQYYEEQSGGSYTVDGTVSNWLTVSGKAKEYGADNPKGGNDNLGPKGPRDLVKEALVAAAKSGIKLSDYDKFDQYDIDGDGNRNEPDGIVDHLMVIHAGTGQEAGGGKLGDDAIWSHRSTLGQPYKVPGTNISAYDYTIEPEDGAVGVFAHEFGHDLGLPDEYDTQYSGQGEPVGVWSIMSDGSWAGKIADTAPTSFSPQNKEFFQKTMGGNWANIKEMDIKDVNKAGSVSVIDQSVTKSKNPGIVKINLPKKTVQGIKPAFGSNYYFSQRGDDLHTTITTPQLDLTKAKTASFKYKANYEVEAEYDYLYVNAILPDGSKVLLDTIGDKANNADNSAETSNGKWEDKSYDLSKFKGKKIKLQFEYVTDGGLAMAGFALDNASLVVDGKTTFTDDAESTPKMTLDGFEKTNGISYKDNYYYLEWRNYAGSDKSLQYARGAKYNTGMVMWYADESYLDNWVGSHPGEGFLGVVDSHAHKVLYFNVNGISTTANSTRYQIADAAFSFDKSPAWSYTHKSWGSILSKGSNGITNFNDRKSYLDERIKDAGRLLPQTGLKVDIIGEAKDNSAGAVWIHK